MSALRLVVALLLQGAGCALVWRWTRGRWRWLAAAVAVTVVLSSLTLSDAHLVDSWGVVAGGAWLFLWSVLIAVGLIAPAILSWPTHDSPRVFVAVALVLAWALVVHVGFIVGPVWERFGVCLAPATYHSLDDGGPACEVGPT